MIRRFLGISMAIKIGQYEPSDVTFWGVATLVAAGIAVLSTSISAVVPDGVYGALHSSRLEGGTLNQLRAQVEQLNVSQRQLLSTTNQLRSQFTLSERNRTLVSQRVGALEVSIPQLLEVIPPGAEIDPLSITASIDGNESETFETEGGSVTLSRTPLFDGAVPSDDFVEALQPQILPEALNIQETEPEESETLDNAFMDDQASSLQILPTPDTLEVEESAETVAILSQTTYGIALGKAVSQGDADAMWSDISSKVGTLLIGLDPAISDPLQNDSFRIVVGPITNYSEAEMLCRRINVVGIECLPVQYDSQ